MEASENDLPNFIKMEPPDESLVDKTEIAENMEQHEVYDQPTASTSVERDVLMYDDKQDFWYYHMGKFLGHRVNQLVYFWPNHYTHIKQRFLALPEGSFFVRWATNVKPYLQLYVRSNSPDVETTRGGIYRRLIVLDQNGFHLQDSDLNFQSLEDLIQHYVNFKEDLPSRLVITHINPYMDEEDFERAMSEPLLGKHSFGVIKQEEMDEPYAPVRTREDNRGRHLKNMLKRGQKSKKRKWCSEKKRVSAPSKKSTGKVGRPRKNAPIEKMMTQDPNIVKTQYLDVSIADPLPDYGVPTYLKPLETPYVSERRRMLCKSAKINGHSYNFTCCRPESRWTPKGVLHIFRCHDCSSYVHKFKYSPLFDDFRKNIPYVAVLGGKLISDPDEPHGKSHMCTNETDASSDNIIIKMEPEEPQEDATPTPLIESSPVDENTIIASQTFERREDATSQETENDATRQEEPSIESSPVKVKVEPMEIQEEELESAPLMASIDFLDADDNFPNESTTDSMATEPQSTLSGIVKMETEVPEEDEFAQANDQVTHLFEATKLYDAIKELDKALFVQRAMKLESNAKNRQFERHVACISRRFPGQKYLFWIRESAYNYEKSFAYCHACYEYKNSFDTKFGASSRRNNPTLIRNIPTVIVNARDRLLLTNPDEPIGVEHFCISQNILNPIAVEPDEPTPKSVLEKLQTEVHDPIDVKKKFGSLHFDPCFDNNGILVYFKSRRYTSYDYEFMPDDNIPITTSIGLVYSFICKECFELKHQTEEYGNNEVPLIYVVNGNEVVHSDPDEPFNAPHFCIPEDLKEETTMRRHRRKEASSMERASSIHSELPLAQPLEQSHDQASTSNDYEEFNQDLDFNFIPEKVNKEEKFLVEMQEKLSGLYIEMGDKIKILEIKPSKLAATHYHPTSSTKKPKVNVNSVVKSLNKIDTPKQLPINKPESRYGRMLKEALFQLLQEGRGSVGLSAIFNRVQRDYNPDEPKKTWTCLKMAIRHGIKRGDVVTAGKGLGYSARFTLSKNRINAEAVDGGSEGRATPMEKASTSQNFDSGCKEVEWIDNTCIKYGRRQFLIKMKDEPSPRWIPEGMLSGANKDDAENVSKESQIHVNRWLKDNGQAPVKFKNRWIAPKATVSALKPQKVKEDFTTLVKKSGVSYPKIVYKEIVSITDCRFKMGRRQFLIRMRGEKEARWVCEGMLNGSNKNEAILISKQSREHINNWLRKNGQSLLKNKNSRYLTNYLNSNKSDKFSTKNPVKKPKVDSTTKFVKSVLKKWRVNRQNTKVQSNKMLKDLDMDETDQMPSSSMDILNQEINEVLEHGIVKIEESSFDF